MNYSLFRHYFRTPLNRSALTKSQRYWWIKRLGFSKANNPPHLECMRDDIDSNSLREMWRQHEHEGDSLLSFSIARGRKQIQAGELVNGQSSDHHTHWAPHGKAVQESACCDSWAETSASKHRIKTYVYWTHYILMEELLLLMNNKGGSCTITSLIRSRCFLGKINLWKKIETN